VSITAVFFDVDFTLIYPGPTFDGEGYRRFGRRHGLEVDPSRFIQAVASASAELDQAQDDIYRPELFVRYARRVLEEMGGGGIGLDPCAREIYDEWAVCQHFALYDDVAPTLRTLHASGFKIGLISNTHRCLASFQSHFELEPFVAAALSSSDHGYMKPHRSIFEAALKLVAARADESVMVGDSLTHDIQGALQVGMQGVLIARSSKTSPRMLDGVPVIQTLFELPALLRRSRDP
jgi:HAD superfamily hydrolase (TIGR01662 family)